MQQSAAACQWTDVPTTMQQSEAACQWTDVPTTMQQSAAACQRTDVPTTLQQSETAYQRTDVPTTMQQEAQVPAPSFATDSPQQTGTIEDLGAVGGSNYPTVSGSSGVNVTYNFPLEGPGVPAPRPQQSQRPDQDPRWTDPSQEAGKKTRDVLKGVYKTTCSSVKLLPGVDNDQMHIAGINTKVQFKTREGRAFVTGQEDIITSTDYSKIFRRRARFGELIKRLIFFGTGIVGVSTMFDKIAYDWADETSEILNGFKLVFLLKMCALSQKSDLVDSTFDQLLGKKSGIEKDELDQFILANPNEVLILLDGFDEMKTKKLNAASFGSILKALNRTVYKECLVCISTRPSHLKILMPLMSLMSETLVQDPCTHVEVLGFTDEDVNDYVQKFYDKDPDIGKALIQTIEKSNTLRYFAKTPVLLFLMCLLWRKSKQLPKTTSRLFTEAIDHMFTRKHLSGYYASNTVIAIGKIALHGLTSANQKFSFQEDEFEPKALELALKAGILTQQRVIKNKSNNNIKFMHKTVQEYCAAKYLQSLNLSSTVGLLTRVKNKLNMIKYQRILNQLCSTFEGVVSNEFLFRFCCGDNEKCMMDIVNLLDRKFNKDRPRYQSSVIQAISRNCFLESQSAKVPLCLTSDSLIPSTIEVFKNDDFQSLMYLLEIICRSDSCKMQLARVTDISISRVSAVSDLAFVLGYMENLRSLRLYRCSSWNGGHVKILSSLKCNQHLTDLGLNISSRRAVEWAPHIKHLTSLNRLELACQALGWDSMEHIASAVANMPKLTDLSLATNVRLGGTVNLWTTELLKMRHLNRLDLSDCSYSVSDAEHIIATVADMPKLTELILAGNGNLIGNAKLWAKELPKVTHLNRLDLGNYVLDPTDIEHIASAAGDMPRLTDLILAGNRRLGGLAELWAKELPKMMHLKKLDLKHCSLLPTDIEHIASAVGNMPRLTNLILAPNWKLAELAQLWAKELPKMVHLKRLVLRECKLTPSDFEHIASAVCNMPSLTDLILDKNKALGASAELWATALPKMRHLSRLDLSHCNLTPSDIGRVTSAVGDMPSLTDFFLAGNPGLDGLDELQSRLPSLNVHVETHLS
ncbi:NLR family CARD domain-containing protein 4-like isoform X2 [Patiria miniata]|uniref:NACHT domain-containing protein n=1 Tax=Patiria miniata TaxID=46514 RepID=A0A913Z3S2_PATMI|nr:NLR family CARD domain-containing protein 4-like isoform X2 [Patiria miniata]